MTLQFDSALQSRFTDIQLIGHGGYGVVIQAHDTVHNSAVALKRIGLVDPEIALRALREIRLLRKLCHDNIAKIKDIVTTDCSNLLSIPSSQNVLQHVYLVQELLDTDLHHVIRSNILTTAHSTCFIYQILRALKYLHSANIVHRDLKPSNVLIDCQQLTAKISDFGLSRVVDSEYSHAGYMTERVSSCWYLAPEQILTPRDYGAAVDVWSAGCIFAEMLLGRAAFPGANELNQMLVILDAIHLEENDWGHVLRVMPNKLLKNHPYRPRSPLAERLLHLPPQGLDLLESLLTFDATRRVSARDAIKHAYLNDYHNREPSARHPLRIEDEVEPLTSEDILQLIVEESNQTSGVNCGTCYSPASSPDPHVMNTSHDSLASRDSHGSHDTHTLDEILDECQTLSDDGASVAAHTASSVQDLNMKNLRKSQDNLHTIMTSYGTDHRIVSGCGHLSGASHVDDTHRSSSQNIALDDDRRSYEQHPPSQTETSSEPVPLVRQKCVVKAHVKLRCDSDDEKDVAEPSPQKIDEDRELESDVISIPLAVHGNVIPVPEQPCDVSAFSVPAQIDVSAFQRDVGSSSPERFQRQPHVFLQLDNDSMQENHKELIQLSPKGSTDSIAMPDVQHGRAPAVTSQRRSASAAAASATSEKERKLLDYDGDGGSCYSKFDCESQENEKASGRAGGGRGNQITSDPDEMYRLPTEHLRYDRRDYSNERIKHKRLSKAVQRQYLAKYREEINELNERLKEASLDGAVGGVETAHDVIKLSQLGSGAGSCFEASACNRLSPQVNRRLDSTNQRRVDLANQHRLDSTNQRRLESTNQRRLYAADRRRSAVYDGFSSPEENPSSPRASFSSSGARPKKSPRKQKAL